MRRRRPWPKAPQHGTVRPGGRTARVRQAVLKAVGDTLVEKGFDALDLAEIARVAGVGKTTVYRRWGTPGALAADLLDDMVAQSLPRARTGSVDEDLRENARRELPRRTDLRRVVANVSAPLYYALLNTGERLDEAAADRAAAAALAAARAVSSSR